MLGALKEQKRTGGMLGPGSPEGRVEGELNAVYLDTRHGTVFVKEYAHGKKNGWVAIGQLVSSQDSSPATGRL
jgi:hypothetical protein